MRHVPPSSRLALVALLCLAARAGGAQQSPEPAPRDIAAALQAVPVGATVRLRSRDMPYPGIVGVVRGHEPGGVQLEANGSVDRVPIGKIRSVELRTGRLDAGEAFERGAMRGFMFGAAIGTAATAVAAYSEYRHPCRDCFVTTTALTAAASVLLTTVTTSIGGFGGLQDRDRWERVWPPR